LPRDPLHPQAKACSAAFGGAQLAAVCIYLLLCQQVTGLLGYMRQKKKESQKKGLHPREAWSVTE